MRHLLVTGGAGFIGSWFVKIAVENGYVVTVLDKLTYSGSLKNLSTVESHKNYNEFCRGDICDYQLVSSLIKRIKPDAIINFAAESHVDNSIASPKEFIETNINGTYNMLRCSLEYYNSLSDKSNFRFIQISTDEVFGSLTKDEAPFSHKSNYVPNSPYSASKAAADHLTRAWFETYGLPVIITNCSNNYGPYQHEEKLIPKTITKALRGEDIPVYGKGENIRDWIYVEDHAQGVLLALQKGNLGRSYLFGGDNEMRNIDIVRKICEIITQKTGKDCLAQIKFVQDRSGHDFRYAIDSSLAKEELKFCHKYSFDEAIENTINWYINSTNL